jgi:WD40 repeat protein
MLLATWGSNDATLKLFDVATGKLLRTFEEHAEAVNSVAFSPDGSSVVSASEDATLKHWDVATGKLLRTFEGDSESVKSAVFSPDGPHGALGQQPDRAAGAAAADVL